jgi:hypothetical protein
MKTIGLLFCLLVAVGTRELRPDLDKVLTFAELKLELLAKVRADLIKQNTRNDRIGHQHPWNAEDFLRRSVKKRADQVFSQLDLKHALPKYSNSVKSRLLEGVTIEISKNATTFIKPLIKSTLLYKVNSSSKLHVMTAPFAKNVILTCSGNSVQVVDLNGHLKTEAIVNFRPDFIQALGHGGTVSNKSRLKLSEIESSFFVANSVGDYKEFTLEVFERKLEEKINKNSSAISEGVPRLSTDFSAIEYTITEKVNRNKFHAQTANFTTSSAVYSSALNSHVFGLHNGEIWFRQRYDNKDVVVKVSEYPVIKLEENTKDSAIIFSSRL